MLHRAAGHLLVHAGLLPEWSAATALSLARRVEKILRRPGGLRTLLGMSPETETEAGPEQTAFRVMTRIRTLKSSGELCGHSGPPETAPEGCRPWFDAPGRKTRELVVVAGHWAALGRRLRPDLLALDSGCVYGGALTAVRLGDRRVFEQANREGSPPEKAG